MKLRELLKEKSPGHFEPKEEIVVTRADGSELAFEPGKEISPDTLPDGTELDALLNLDVKKRIWEDYYSGEFDRWNIE